MLKSVGDDHYLIAVNMDNYSTDVEFRFTDYTVMSAEVLFEGSQQPTVNGNVVSDSFGPFGVHVYRLELSFADSDGAECVLASDPNDAGSKPPSVPPGDGDADGLPAAVEALFGSSDSNKDSDGDGIQDGVEVKGWGTSPVSTDTDGDSSGNDGCQDDKQIVDVNRDRQVNILDVQVISSIALSSGPFDPMSETVADINRDGANNILDVALAASNSTLVEPHDRC